MANPATSLSSATPVLLLPVRVQTKFRSAPTGEQLLVRIYPDQISVNRHEEALTDSEISAGKNYWQQALIAPDRSQGTPHSLLAWQVLIEKYGAARSAWIVQQLTPNRLRELIERSDAGEKKLTIVFPTLNSKAGWEQAAQATCLPDRFIVSLYQRHENPDEVRDPYIQEQLLQNGSITNTGNSAGFDYDLVVDLTSEFLYLAKQVEGNPVSSELAVGLDPGAMVDGEEGELDSAEGLSGDLKWLADFDQAVAQGMAVIVPLDGDEYETGFKRLVVLGVRDNRAPEEEAENLHTLLQGHYYTDGLEIVPQGTPTNNTGEEGAGYSSGEQVDTENSFHTYLKGPLFEPLDASQRFEHRDGQRLADALGLAPEFFQQVAHADGTDGQEAMQLNRLLWPATFGYFLRERLQPVLGKTDAIERTRQFFEEFVSGRGPLSAFRVGNEPYGVLPTAQYSQWQPPQSQDDFGVSLWDIIRRLDTTWTERLNQAVHYTGVLFDAPYGTEVGAPYKQDFLTILGQEAASIEFYQRYWVGPNIMENLAQQATNGNVAIWPLASGNFTNRPNSPARFTSRNPLYDEFRIYFDPKGKLGLTQSLWPRLFDTSFQSNYRKVVHTYANEPNPQPTVTGAMIDNALLSETNPVEPFLGSKPSRNFIHWLSDRSFEEIRLEDFSAEFPTGNIPSNFTPPNSLLYRLLRQAVMLRYWEAAVQELGNIPIPQEEAEFFNIFARDTARWDWLYYPASFLGGTPLHKYLQSGRGSAGPALREYLDQLRILADVPTARLERLLAEHIDLGSHRIDAWKTGQVMSQLVESRIDQPMGIYLGAYGWLEDVVRQDRSTLVAADGILDDPDNLGYIHAPSVNHGVAAAVLRQGYKSRQFETDPLLPQSKRMEINLSSERVRRALAVLEGVRTGGSLAAILGREFEEGLYQATPANAPSFARQIDVFRQSLPFISEKVLLGQDPAASTQSSEQKARQVVNGLLLALMGPPQAGTQYPYNYPFPTLRTQDEVAFFNAVSQQVSKLRDTLDALGDLTVGESIFQAVSGNIEQAAAMLENVAKGKFPTSPDVVRVPKAGVSFTQRVLLHLPESEPDKWPAKNWGGLTPAAVAEPALNNLLLSLLGDPAQISFYYTLTPTGKATIDSTLTLAQVGVQPIDLLYLLDENPLQSGSLLDLNLAHVIRSLNADDEDKSGLVTINYDKAGVLPLRRLLPLVGRLRQLLATSRSAGPNDLIGPSSLAPGQVLGDVETVDADEIIVRLKAVQTQMENSEELLKTQLTAIAAHAAAKPPVAPTPAELADLRDTLHTIGSYGLAEAHQATGAANENLPASAVVVLQALTRRLVSASQLQEKVVQTGNYAEWAQALLGPSFRVAFAFSLPTEAESAYSVARGSTTQLLRHHGQNPLVMDEWLQGVAPVREPLDHLEKVLTLNELLNEGDTSGYLPLALHPAQLSARALPTGEEYWLGMSYPSDYTPPTDAVSLVQIFPTIEALPTTYPNTYRALWLDEWVEVIPHNEEDTAVVFHYDQPNTEAPQTILLAVAPRPDINPNWDWEGLLGAVNETLDLAKKRTVEPGALAYTHLCAVLPAVVAPVAQEAVTMTLDFRRINNTAEFEEKPLSR